jgi:hypothetical protein
MNSQDGITASGLHIVLLAKLFRTLADDSRPKYANIDLAFTDFRWQC